jgi:hypothetical protein
VSEGSTPSGRPTVDGPSTFERDAVAAVRALDRFLAASERGEAPVLRQPPLAELAASLDLGEADPTSITALLVAAPTAG